jgi:hypothetical protein
MGASPGEITRQDAPDASNRDAEAAEMSMVGAIGQSDVLDLP